MSDVMDFLTKTRTRVAVTSVLLVGIPVTVAIGRDQGWYPKNVQWSYCTGVPREYVPCRMQDGNILVVHNGRLIIYPTTEEP